MPAHDASQAFDKADALIHALDAHAELVEALPLFSYRHGHDLSGYKDGTENPTGDEAWAGALASGGGSIVLVQRWLHFRDRMAAMPAEARDHVIGRRLVDDEEIAEAPESAHVKRTAQEDFDDGLQDALLGHSQAETGAFYWCPPWDGQRLLLPAVSASVPPPAPLPAPTPCVVRVCQHGPLELTGALMIAGTPATSARLCRCGQSANKPFCDGSHADAGFTAPS